VSLATPAVGTEAPDFTLPSTSGTELTLSALRGRSNVVLAFFPLAFTGVCTTEMCDFTLGLQDFADMHTMVFGISVDSVPTLKEFKAKHGILIDLLSDFKRSVSRAYGVLLEEQFFSRRAYFIVDRAGRIQWSHVESELGDRRENVELLSVLRSLA